MPTVQKSLRLSDAVVHEINEIAKSTRKDFTSVTNDLLEEALRAHRCPGIVFSEGVSGRRARIAGTGIEVWEVISAYLNVEKSLKRLKQSYEWLTDQQVKTAVGYYTAYPVEIDSLIIENEAWTPETIKRKYPFLAAGKQ